MLGRVHSLSLLIKFSLLFQPFRFFLGLSSLAAFSSRVGVMLRMHRALQKDGRGMHLRPGNQSNQETFWQIFLLPHGFPDQSQSLFLRSGEILTAQEEDNSKWSIPYHPVLPQTALILLGGKKVGSVLPGMQAGRAVLQGAV